MYAKELAHLLHWQLAEGDFDETLKRFDALRGCNLLPRGRENAGQRLSDQQVVSALLGFAARSASDAGFKSLGFSDLRPVGGVAASYKNAATLGEVLRIVIADYKEIPTAFGVTLSIDRCREREALSAKFDYANGERQCSVQFVSKLAYSLLQPGAENAYDHLRNAPNSGRQLFLGRGLFYKVALDVARSRAFNAPFKTDWQEYENEEDRQSFHKRLGAKPGSDFLNLGVDTGVTWPKEPCRIKFGGHHLVLFPKTRDNAHSISIDLKHEKLTAEAARTLMNRFLTMLAWCCDSHAVLGYGSSGHPVPAPRPRENLAFVTAAYWLFDRQLPADQDLLERLAYYREALNATEAGITTYAVLSFFKVFEVRQRSRQGVPNLTKAWIAAEFANACASMDQDTLRKFHQDCGKAKVEKYIFEKCRTAAAHTSAEHPSDADASPEIQRLHTASEVMLMLAQHFIRTRFSLTKDFWDASTR